MGAGSTKDRVVFSLLESCTWVLLLQAPAMLVLDATFMKESLLDNSRFFSLQAAGMALENIVLLWVMFYFFSGPKWSKILILLYCLVFGVFASWFSLRYFSSFDINDATTGRRIFGDHSPWLFYFSTCLLAVSVLMACMPLKHGVNSLGAPATRVLWHRHFMGTERFAFFGVVVIASALALLALVHNLSWLSFQGHQGGSGKILAAFQPDLPTQAGDIGAQYAKELIWVLYFLRFALLVVVVSFLIDFFQQQLGQAELKTVRAKKNAQHAWQKKAEFESRLIRATNSKNRGLVSWAARGPDAHLNIDPLCNNAADLHFELSNLNLMKIPDVQERSLRAFFSAWVLEEDFVGLKNALNTFFNNREETLRLEFRAILKDNSVAIFSFTAKLIRHFANGAPLFLDGFITNVTEETKAQNDLQDISYSRMQTIYAVCHDLGSPLGLIQMSSGFLASLLKREGSYSAAAQKFLDRIDNSVKESHFYLSNALSMAKSDDPNFKFEPACVNMHVLLEKIVEAQAPMYQFDLNRVQFETTQACCIEAIQEYPLQMIFQNLVSNAFKYTHHADAQVVIRLYSQTQAVAGLETPQCIVEIQDNGIGISDSLKDKLFQPFSRGDNVDDVKGTGLGLTVVKRATDLLNAKIDLVPSGQGACFRLTLPHALVKPVSDPVSS
ncbi:MAG: HAMP domain-containing histidine kinase [Burkholderiales bacterium]|nr:HAMP domain-containing histidine kinase [Burkholderiales bacterium]